MKNGLWWISFWLFLLNFHACSMSSDLRDIRRAKVPLAQASQMPEINIERGHHLPFTEPSKK